ncbi:MAG TPA: hypothetical protein VNO52_05950 [Methylomirabilota bacterium]|nr:hypothetical protein [Methylomirabilota bacterium]
MKFLRLLILPLVLTGCATSTIEKRRAERLAAYQAFPPDVKAAVDQGQLRIGMSTNAVYIAWGRPSQVLVGESKEGRTMTWLYYGTQLREIRYWTYRPYSLRGDCHYPYPGAPYLAFDYVPENYVRAEVQFAGDVVTAWRSLPPPP